MPSLLGPYYLNLNRSRSMSTMALCISGVDQLATVTRITTTLTSRVANGLRISRDGVRRSAPAWSIISKNLKSAKGNLGRLKKTDGDYDTVDRASMASTGQDRTEQDRMEVP